MKRILHYLILIIMIFILLWGCDRKKIQSEIAIKPTINPNNNLTLSIIGIWQKDDYIMAAGWFDNFQFFPDGNFVYNYNTMDDTKRIINFSGNYEIKGNKLKLYKKIIKKIEGGELSKEPGMNGFYIINGVEITEQVDPPQELLYEISEITLFSFTLGKEFVNLPLVHIDGVKYYKLESDPDQY